MKTNFKPLGLAAAVAAVTAGYAGVSAAQTVVHNSSGDLAIVPYYTVQENWGTGVHIINTSDQTQVVKLRFRRGSDSLGALDLNLILPPEDQWVGFLNDNGGAIRLTTQDTSCTAPLPPTAVGPCLAFTAKVRMRVISKLSPWVPLLPRVSSAKMAR